MCSRMPTFQTIRDLFTEATRAPGIDDEPADDADEPPELGLRRLNIQSEGQSDSFKRQLYVSPPRNQSSLLSKMLTSPVSAGSDGGSSTGADALSDSGYTSRNTTPTPPPVSLNLPPPACAQTKSIIRFTNATANSTNNTGVEADVDKKPGECTVNVLKRSIKFACTGGKESCREQSSSSAVVPDAPGEKNLATACLSEQEVYHPQPQRILRVDDVLLKERHISRLNAEVEAEDNDDNDDDDEDVGNGQSFDDPGPTRPQIEGDELDEDDDTLDDDDDNRSGDEDQDDLSPETSSSPVLAPGSVRGKMLARLQRTPFIEYESEGEEVFHGNIEDGYASDDDDDGMSEYNDPAANMQQRVLLDRLSRLRPLHMVQRTATPPANMIPDSSDFVCGTFDEDRPIEVAYYSALEERARYNHKPCPQDIDPSFPEDVDEDSDDAKSDNESEGSRRPCRSPPPVHHTTRHHHNIPVPVQMHGHHRDHGATATSFQHNRPLFRNHMHNNINKSANRERGAIDIVKGLERKNNRRRERRHQYQHPHHDVVPGEGVEKMRQLGLVAVKKGDNPYAEWMLSV
ncbi:hypothetical protein V1520DRAFT_151083 [Lipomyces starkeyi]|uniref:Uncharacterized protein n=1 Tax=Lipomyces starkeyi NRRL Y-11557 TaxID=675824 RepID=A0A1E3Q621_LIPST|nr:hypothetical protein LIPSTDRAFT_71492 [Lipomyces starkeyi NRRL Y-11557]